MQLDPRLQRQVVSYSGREAPGTVIIDTPHTYLYYVLGGGKAIRYGIGVGREGFTWSGVKSIERKAEWPDWYPPAEMLARQPYLPRMLQSRLRNDPAIERTAREQWVKMCRSIPLGGGKTGLPPLWLEMRPVRAAAAQPQVDARNVTITVGVQAETRILPNETKPTCPFPAQLELVPPMQDGVLAVGVPIDMVRLRPSGQVPMASPFAKDYMHSCNQKRIAAIDEPSVLPPEKWPKTVEATVADIIAGMSNSDKEMVRKTKRDELSKFHFSWGMGIRNHYGLLRGNEELLRDACDDHWLLDADEASHRIVEAVWDALETSK